MWATETETDGNWLHVVAYQLPTGCNQFLKRPVDNWSKTGSNQSREAIKTPVHEHIVIGGLYLTVKTSTHEHVVIGRLYLTVKTFAHEHVVIGGLYLTIKTSTHEYAVIGRLLMDSQNLCP